MDKPLKKHCGRGYCLSGPRLMGRVSGRSVGWLSALRRMEASFVVFGMMMGCLTGRRMWVSSGARWESHWRSGPRVAGQKWNCNGCLGLSLHWARERGGDREGSGLPEK